MIIVYLHRQMKNLKTHNTYGNFGKCRPAWNNRTSHVLEDQHCYGIGRSFLCKKNAALLIYFRHLLLNSLRHLGNNEKWKQKHIILFFYVPVGYL